MTTLELILIISVLVVTIVAIVALVIINLKASKIKKQVEDGTYISDEEKDNTEKNAENKDESSAGNDDIVVEEEAEKAIADEEISIERDSEEKIDYSKKTVAQLKTILKDNKVEFKSTMRKEDLINLLNK